jgi:MFS transporter, FSR family, fosmidomycin resistance protein
VARLTKNAAARPAVLSMSGLLVALSVEFADELVDGTKGAAVPLIRTGLGLSYSQIGLLAALPLVVGGLLELPFGLLAGDGSRRWRMVLGGGAVFTGSLLAAAAARSFIPLLIAFVIFFPASGAFVSLTQSALMDADPGRRVQHLARWTVAGSAGSVAGPLLLAAVAAAGGGWRTAYLLLAGAAALACLGVARCGPLAGGPPGPAAEKLGPAERDQPVSPAAEAEPVPDCEDASLRTAVSALRRGDVRRWLVLLEVADLLLDVLSGFLALYLVAVARATPAQAALGVAIRLAAGLAGDVLVIRFLDRFGSLGLLRAGAAAAAVLYPAFLMVPGLGAKLAVLAALSVATAPWYPAIQAELYRSLPGRSGIAVSLSSAAGLLGGLGPLAVGFLAQRFSLAWAVTSLAVAPVAVLIVMPRRSRRTPGADPLSG